MSIRIRNGLTRKDSSILEKQYVDTTKKTTQIDTISVTIT
jgi:hypothetical protein